MLASQHFCEMKKYSLFLISTFLQDSNKRYVSISSFLRNRKIQFFLISTFLQDSNKRYVSISTFLRNGNKG